MHAAAAQRVERLVGADLVLHPRQRFEVRHDRSHPAFAQARRLGREHGHLLLGGHEQVEAVRAVVVDRRVEPTERVHTKTRDRDDLAHVAGETAQAHRVGREHLDVMAGAPEQSRALASGQPRPVAQQDPHAVGLAGSASPSSGLGRVGRRLGRAACARAAALACNEGITSNT